MQATDKQSLTQMNPSWKIALRAGMLAASSAKITRKSENEIGDIVRANMERVCQIYDLVMKLKDDQPFHVPGVHFIPDGAYYIFNIESMPGIIFKVIKNGLRGYPMKERWYINRTILARIRSQQLKHIVMPNSVYFARLQGRSLDLLVEEELELHRKGDGYAQAGAYAFCCTDPELLPKMNVYLKELALLISHFSLRVIVNYSTFPLLANGTGIALLDPNRGADFEEGLSSLLEYTYKENEQAILDRVREKKPHLVENLNLDAIAYLRQNRMDAYRPYINFSEKRYCFTGKEPIDIPAQQLSELPTFDQKLVGYLAAYINKCLARDDTEKTMIVHRSPLLSYHEIANSRECKGLLKQFSKTLFLTGDNSDLTRTMVEYGLTLLKENGWIEHFHRCSLDWQILC